MDAKRDIQTLPGQCYLCTKAGCSGAANNRDSTGWNLSISCTSQFHCAQAHATDLSQDQVNPSLEGATLSLLRYDSKFTAKSVKSVITRSRYPGFCTAASRNMDKTIVGRHMTT